MLHALTSETKTETVQSKPQFAPSARQELHPFLPGMVSQHMLGGGRGNARSNHAPGGQRHQTLAGLQATYGNQAVLRTLHTFPQVARMTPSRPSQGVMLQRKCVCERISEAEEECAGCQAEHEETL